MMRASGCSRRARRIAWRAWRSASAVTAQVLMMTASASPASPAARRMTSLSNALRRQPNVTISTAVNGAGAIALAAEEPGIEAALEGEGRGAGHDHVARLIVLPQDVEIAAVEHDRRSAPGEAAAMGRDERGTGAGAAGKGDAGAALPDAQ